MLSISFIISFAKKLVDIEGKNFSNPSFSNIIFSYLTTEFVYYNEILSFKKFI